MSRFERDHCSDRAEPAGEVDAFADLALASKREDSPMDDTGPLTLLMNVVGPIEYGAPLWGGRFLVISPFSAAAVMQESGESLVAHRVQLRPR